MYRKVVQNASISHLVSGNWGVYLHLWWLVSSFMERILQSCLFGYPPCSLALIVIWLDGLLRVMNLWYYAVLVLIAGHMDNAEVAITAFSICLNINALEFMICLGFLGAACVRVANELGKGNANAVRFSIKVLIATSLLIGVIFSSICFVFHKELLYFFTNDKEVADTVSDLSVLLGFSVFLNSMHFDSHFYFN